MPRREFLLSEPGVLGHENGVFPRSLITTVDSSTFDDSTSSTTTDHATFTDGGNAYTGSEHGSNPDSRDLRVHLPFDEGSSASTAIDRYNGNDEYDYTSSSAASPGTNPGLGGYGSLAFDGSGPQMVSTGDLPGFDTGTYTSFAFWFKPYSRGRGAILDDSDRYSIWWDRGSNSGINWAVYGGNSTLITGLDTNTWHHIGIKNDHSNYGDTVMYLNGSRTDRETHGDYASDGDPDFGATDTGDYPLDGELAEFRVYRDNTPESTFQKLYDQYANGGVVTDTVTFDSGSKPDYTDFVYTLNGGSVTVTCRASPGTSSEETNSFTINSSGVNSYDMNWSGSHTKFRSEFDMTPGDVESHVRFDSYALTG